MNIPPPLRLIYLIVVPVIGFWADSVPVTLGLLLLQLVLWVALRIPFHELRHLRRVRRFALLLVLVSSLFYGKTDFVLLAVGSWELGASLEGFVAGLLMIAKLAIMLLAAQIVQSVTPPDKMIAGMRSLGMSKDSAEVMSSLLDLAGGRRRKRDKASARPDEAAKQAAGGRKKHGKPISIRALLRGDLSAVYDRIDSQRKKVASQFSDSELAITASYSALIVLVRFIKIAPGLPVAPGHKNVLIIPFFVAASRHSRRPWAGAKIGFYSGMIHFMSGFGKYGPVGVAQFVMLGAVIDGLVGVFRRSDSLWVLGIIGIVSGFFRVISEIIIAYILNVPIEFYLFYLPFIISHCLFGAASAPISRQLLKQENQE